MSDNKSNMHQPDGIANPSAPVGTYQLNPPSGTFQQNPHPPVGAYPPNPPVGAYPPNPPVGAYQPNPYQYQANPNPPAGTFQAITPPIVTYPVMEATPGETNTQHFNRELARKLSISLIILGIVTFFSTSWALHFVGVIFCFVAIGAGITGNISSRDPSKNKIVAFNIFSSLSTIANVIAIFVTLSFFLATNSGFLAITLILHGVIVCLSGIGAYSSFRQFGWLGSGFCAQEQHEGVVHRSDNEAPPHVNNTIPPGQNVQNEGTQPYPHGQSAQYNGVPPNHPPQNIIHEEVPEKPPAYEEAVKIVD